MICCIVYCISVNSRNDYYVTTKGIKHSINIAAFVLAYSISILAKEPFIPLAGINSRIEVIAPVFLCGVMFNKTLKSCVVNNKRNQ